VNLQEKEVRERIREEEEEGILGTVLVSLKVVNGVVKP
jgi:hypothetical protein